MSLLYTSFIFIDASNGCIASYRHNTTCHRSPRTICYNPNTFIFFFFILRKFVSEFKTLSNYTFFSYIFKDYSSPVIRNNFALIAFYRLKNHLYGLEIQRSFPIFSSHGRSIRSKIPIIINFLLQYF